MDPALSAQYRWSACGRIDGSEGRPIAALYGAEDSILSIDEWGRVRAYRADFPLQPQTLVPPVSGPLRTWDYNIALSFDGLQLLRLEPTAAEIYVAADAGRIGAHSGPLRRMTRIDRAASGCVESASFSVNRAHVVGTGPSRVCIWDSETGALRSALDLPTTPSEPVETPLAGIGTGAQPVRIFYRNQLFTATLAGALVESFDVGELYSEASALAFSLAPDAETLMALLPGTGVDAPPQVSAVETSTGTERWRVSARKPFATLILAFSNDGYVLLPGDAVLRLEDGEIVSDDFVASSWRASLGPGGRRKLTVGELIGEVDLFAGQFSNLLGSHAMGVVALDASRDGRFLASHGDAAVLWELGAEFADARPLAQGRAPDSSWNVAIAPDGSAMVVSGDNISFVRRDGTIVPGDPPPNGALNCLSPDWSFSPRGTVVAGNNYGKEVHLRDATTFATERGLATNNCGGGVAFSPDGSWLVTASLELFETAGWSRVWINPSGSANESVLDAESAVEFSPDSQEILVTRCESFDSCSSERYAAHDGVSRGRVPELHGSRVRYSPEGHWLVSNDRALHWPSGVSLEYAPKATVALFLPDGDIIAGEDDGSLVRYCRRTE